MIRKNAENMKMRDKHSKTRIQGWVKDYLDRHDYMKDKDPNQVTSILVYDYLVQNGYKDIAQKLAQTILNKSDCNHKRKLSESGSCSSDKIESKVSKMTDPDRVTFTLVSDYLDQHGYQALSQELRNEVKYSKLDLECLNLPDLSTILSNSRFFQVPEKQPKKRKSESCDTNTKTKMFKLSAQDPDSLDDLNQKVTITDLFIDKVEDLKTLPEDSEIPKVVKFILDTNIKVRKSMRNTVLFVDKRSCQDNFPYIRFDNLSGLRYGKASEESLILQHWNNLVKEVPIDVPDKFLMEIEETSLTWCQLLLGAYLSQDLTENHRLAAQLFKALIGLKKRRGAYVTEEDELILALDAKNASKEEFKTLAWQLGRTQLSVTTRLNYLKDDKGKARASKYTEFTLDEDRKILEYVNERFDISTVELLKSVKRREQLSGLKEILHRGLPNITNRWNCRLMPVLLSYMYGVPEIQWKEEFLKYVVQQKVTNMASMDWADVLQKWPYQNRFSLTKLLDTASNYSKEKLPLYQLVSAYLSHPIKPISKKLIDRRRAILKIFDEIRFGNKK